MHSARSLIAHRNGPDRVYLTADDNRFDTMAEVDAQYYVGRSAMNRLEAYATQAGYVPGGSDIVGAWEGIQFTMNEVTDTLALVNDASEGELDDDIGLNSRAVDGILAARPIATMNELADARYVGKSAMNTLLDHVIENALADSGESCDTSDDCKDGLVCLGELAWGTGLFCVDDTMYGTFSNNTSIAIPDNGRTVTSTVNVSGLASVPVDVVLTLDIDHPRPSDLVVTSTTSMAILKPFGITTVLHPTKSSFAFPSDDMVNGNYSIHIEDTVSGQSGILNGWDLYIVSNWD